MFFCYSKSAHRASVPWGFYAGMTTERNLFADPKAVELKPKLTTQ